MGCSSDLMRRDRDADPGLNELMIVAAIRAAPELGISRLSLNFSVFRSALERGAGSAPGRSCGSGGPSCCGRRGGSRSSRCTASTRSSGRCGSPLHLLPGAGELPRIAIAALEAEAFIVGPKQLLAIRRARRQKAAAVVRLIPARAAVPRIASGGSRRQRRERRVPLGGAAVDVAAREASAK